jgi:hypothetical protein
MAKEMAVLIKFETLALNPSSHDINLIWHVE